jgi:hypothetical protein
MLNRYLYTGGDPINHTDADGNVLSGTAEPPPVICGWDFGESRKVCSFTATTVSISWRTPAWITDAINEAADRKRNYDLARKYLQKSIENIFQQQRNGGFGADCDKTMAALGTSMGELVGRINTTHIIDGSSSRRPVATLALGDNIGSILPMPTVAQVMSLNPGINAMGQLGGDKIFINPEATLNSGVDQNAARFLHELIHNQTGMLDTTIQRKLGLTEDRSNTENITQKIQADCIK